MIHSSHGSEARIALIITGILLVLFVISVNIDWPLIRTISDNYTLIHTAFEIIVIIIASLTFSIIWGIRQEKPSPSLVLIACAFLCVAILNFVHMMSYAEMPDFITPGSREKSIYFWQAAQLFGSAALLIIAIRPVRTYRPQFNFTRVLPVFLLLTAAAFWLYFAFLANSVNLYLIDNQLTDTKLYVEYFLIFIAFVAAGLYLKRIFEPREFNTSAMFAACFVLGLGEYFYTLYGPSRDIYNLIGHIYKIIGFGFLYWAVFVETLRNPYRQLRESRQQLRATMQAMPDLVFEVDENYQFIANYSAYTQGLYVEEQYFIGKTIQEVMPPEVADLCINALDNARQHGISRGNIICLPIGNQSRWFELSVSIKPEPDRGLHFVVISRDITERLESEKALRVLSQAFSQSPIAFFITDVNHFIELCNQAYAKICNSEIDDLLGKRPDQVANAKLGADQFKEIVTRIEQGRYWRGELVYASIDGQDIFLRALVFPVRNSAGQISNYITYLENITEHKKANARIRQLSHYDQLTSLPNVSLLTKHFDFLLGRQSKIVVLWLDLDNFKDINDSLGYPAGDELLRTVAARLQALFNSEHMVSRLSGDDFLLIKSIKNHTDASLMANEVLEVFAEPVLLSGQKIYVTASAGVVLCPDDGNSMDDLLKKAESAKYRAKNLGRNNICFYTQDLQSDALRFLELRSALKHAHLRDELRMVFQPQFNMETQSLIGAEALIRWRSPQWGDVPPEEFMRIAEASGIIVELGDWILRTTLKHISDWSKQGLNGLRIAINLSPIQFNSPDLATKIVSLLAEHGLTPDCLTLEITEAMAMSDPQSAESKIHELQALGVKFAIDDFGTGYSSLSYLKRFKLHKIKIDKSFIKELDTNTDDQAIVNAIIKMAHQLDILTIAEGVETFDQMMVLKELGSDEIQGFYFSKPLESNEFLVFAQKSKLSIKKPTDNKAINNHAGRT